VLWESDCKYSEKEPVLQVFSQLFSRFPWCQNVKVSKRKTALLRLLQLQLKNTKSISEALTK